MPPRLPLGTVTAAGLRTVLISRRLVTAAISAGLRTMLTSRRVVTAAIAAALLLAAFPPSGHAEARVIKPFGSCAGVIESAGPSWSCARVTVPLDRSEPQSGTTVTLSVARRHAPGPPRPALVGLAGGPGEAALPLAERLVERLAPLSAGRDVLLFDQRGTGRSGALTCRALDDDSGSVGDCARELGASAGFYGTRQTVEDLEDLRALLNIPSVSLYGVSYGTVTAQDYLRSYPERVDRMVLDSAFDAEAGDPQFTDSFAAVRRVIGSLCPAGGCPGVTKDPLGDLRRVAARAQAGELTAPVRVGRHGRERRSMSATQLVFWILGQSYDPSDIGALPALLAAAARGDATPVLRHRLLVTELRAQAKESNPASPAAYWATWCADAVRPTSTTGDDVFDPFGSSASRAVGNADRCAQWPAVTSAEPSTSAVSRPTLILSGDLDMVTPLETAERLRGRFGETSQVVRVPGVGHDILGEDRPCVRAALRDFSAGQPVAAAACKPVPRRLLRPFARRSAELSSQRGLRRALTALDATLANVEGEFSERWVFVADGWAGLRGGWARLRGGFDETVEFHRYRFVEDVALTGRAGLDSRGRVATGRLRMRWAGGSTAVTVKQGELAAHGQRVTRLR